MGTFYIRGVGTFDIRGRGLFKVCLVLLMLFEKLLCQLVRGNPKNERNSFQHSEVNLIPEPYNKLSNAKP